MIRVTKSSVVALTVLAGAAIAAIPGSTLAATAAELNRDGQRALRDLYAQQPSAKLLSQHAKGILVFPAMLKAGFLFGGQLGEGVLLKQGKPVAYYNSVAASYGLQAGAQTFGYALFFMNQQALDQLDSTMGFELGVGPSVVIVDQGVGKSLTTNTMTSDVYAFIFDQKGLMAGIGIQGSKITRVSK